MVFTPARRFTLITALILALISPLAVTIPSVRAFLGLNPSSNDISIQATMTFDLWAPISTVQSIATSTVLPDENLEPTTPIFTGNIDLSADPNIQQLNELTGWIIKTPAFLPEGFHFDSSYYDSTNQMVYLIFLATRQLPGSDLTETKSLTLVEAKRNDSVPLKVDPSAILESAIIADTPAVYTIGAWDSNFVENDNEPNGGHMEWNWRNDLQVENVFWQEDEVYLVIITDDTQTSKNDLLKMADSIR
jgi:hypothetical protein